MMAGVGKFQRAVTDWENAVESGDVVALMAMLSESFASSQWENRAALRKQLEKVLGPGNLSVNTEDAHLRLASFGLGAKARVEEISVTSGSKAGAWVISLVLDRDGWRITDWQMR